jgi:hypothetical protein
VGSGYHWTPQFENVFGIFISWKEVPECKEIKNCQFPACGHSLAAFYRRVCQSFRAMKVFFGLLLFYICAVAGLLIPQNNIRSSEIIGGEKVSARAISCENTATSRSCWGDYNIDTDYYDVVPDTGVTREVCVVIQSFSR